MSIYETEDLFEFGPIPVRVRVWHDDAHGMQAEPLQFKLHDMWRTIGINGMADDVIRAGVAEEYTECHLERFMHTDPAFKGLPYDEPPVSQSEYEDMRL